MDCTASYIAYEQTGSFSNIILDYLLRVDELRPFYAQPVSVKGIKAAIEERKNYPTNRQTLAEELHKQYQLINPSETVITNINLLRSENCFTITTAHQPNIFTGHLYFIYKILHAIRLADQLNNEIKDCHFVPVYYMGSEDADLEELGAININGKKYEWRTDQKGAVGRMKVDKDLVQLINEIEGQVSVEKYGKEIIDIIRKSYVPGETIEQATFTFVNELFKDYGLLVFLPDNPAYKQQFYPVNSKELDEQFSYKIVAETIQRFPEKYKVQAAGRDINLFYLKDDNRERIEIYKEGYAIANTNISFTREAMREELIKHPEHFSPNVILRPLFQEMILPNIVFIGGGGELAYWLELKKVFEAVHVPYPVMVLRNSFMIMNKKQAARIAKLKFHTDDFFKPAKELIDILVKRETGVRLNVDEEKASIKNLYAQIKSVATTIDNSLQQHVDALCTQSIKRLELLEGKMLKAEKKKFEAQQRQIHKIKDMLFPGNSLQERVDNLVPYYAIWGKDFIKILYEYSKGLEQEFCILEEEE